jgi:hypothetical protein
MKTKDKANGNTIELTPARGNVLAPPPDAEMGIVLPQFDTRTIRIKLEGTSPLITHAWSEKAKKMMRDKQMGKATAGKETKDPEKDMEGAMYRTPDGKPGVPAISFKNAAVTACTSLGKAITKVAARQAFHVLGDIIPITGKYYCREDMVRVGMGTADIRYRPCWDKWSVEIDVRFNARVISAEQVVNLFNVAGFAVGICEWRPECNGQMGCFKVA